MRERFEKMLSIIYDKIADSKGLLLENFGITDYCLIFTVRCTDDLDSKKEFLKFLKDLQERKNVIYELKYAAEASSIIVNIHKKAGAQKVSKGEPR